MLQFMTYLPPMVSDKAFQSVWCSWVLLAHLFRNIKNTQTERVNSSGLDGRLRVAQRSLCLNIRCHCKAIYGGPRWAVQGVSLRWGWELARFVRSRPWALAWWLWLEQAGAAAVILRTASTLLCTTRPRVWRTTQNQKAAKCFHVFLASFPRLFHPFDKLICIMPSRGSATLDLAQFLRS